MPYKHAEDKNRNARDRHAILRAKFFAGKCCVVCGSTDQLELDHIDPDSKSKNTSKVWQFSDEEILTCQVLCHDCHVKKTAANKENLHGKVFRPGAVPTVKLTENDIPRIRELVAEGKSFASVGRLYGVHGSTIRRAAQGNTWNHVE